MRDHEVFRTPRSLDLQATLTAATPDHWAPYLLEDEGERVTFLPLVPAAVAEAGSWRAGWCTYAEHVGSSPDVEILCGGMNSKLPSAAAVWRQGNLLHFGFEQDPGQLNDNGRALLENCIVYIARFRSDRPLAATPSPFVDAEYPRPLRYMKGALAREGSTVKTVLSQFAAPWSEELAGLSMAELRDWVADHEGYLCSGKQGRLTVDEDAEALALPLSHPEFAVRAVAALDDPATADRARALLARRVPEGPGADAAPAAWRAFVAVCAPYLFFLEEGGHRWHLDPLARARGVPCDRLRGPARADPPAAPPPLEEWNGEARTHAAAARIVRGIVRVDAAAVQAARRGGGHVDVFVEVHETIHCADPADASEKVAFRHFVHGDGDPGPHGAPDADGLLALDGQDRIAFLVLVEDRLYLADTEAGHGLVEPGRDTIIRVRQREMLHRELLDGKLEQDPDRRRGVRELLAGVCVDAEKQRAAFARLEALGEEAVVEIVAAMDDRRPLPDPSLTLTNHAADRFEAARHYGPKQVVDGIAAVLNQLTGESLGWLYNGASDRERDLAVRAWTLYAHYLQMGRQGHADRDR